MMEGLVVIAALIYWFWNSITSFIQKSFQQNNFRVELNWNPPARVGETVSFRVWVRALVNRQSLDRHTSFTMSNIKQRENAISAVKEIIFPENENQLAAVEFKCSVRISGEYRIRILHCRSNVEEGSPMKFKFMPAEVDTFKTTFLRASPLITCINLTKCVHPWSAHQPTVLPMDVVVSDLPLIKNVAKIKTRLKKLSDNCGGKVVSIQGQFAILRFPNNEAALRATKRMNGEDVFGSKIQVLFSSQVEFSPQHQVMPFQVEFPPQQSQHQVMPFHHQPLQQAYKPTNLQPCQYKPAYNNNPPQHQQQIIGMTNVGGPIMQIPSPPNAPTPRRKGRKDDGEWKREQTPQEIHKTRIFATEVYDLLRHSIRCEMRFSKFIPSYHHHFGRQCRVSDYGFYKLVELFEAISDTVVAVNPTNSHEDCSIEDKILRLTPREQLKVVGEQLWCLIEKRELEGLHTGLEDLEELYLKEYGFLIRPDYCGAENLNDLVKNKLNQFLHVDGERIILVDRAKVEDRPIPESKHILIDNQKKKKSGPRWSPKWYTAVTPASSMPPQLYSPCHSPGFTQRSTTDNVFTFDRPVPLSPPVYDLWMRDNNSSTPPPVSPPMVWTYHPFVYPQPIVNGYFPQ